MYVLGIESTAHTIGIGLVEDGKILKNALHTYNALGEGIVPRKAAEHHVEWAPKLLKEVEEVVDIKEVDYISVAIGPGIGTTLKIGNVLARYLAIKYNKPLIPVHHGHAHLCIAQHFAKLHDPIYVYVSGGNTQILIYEKKQLKVVGETIDIGIGNLFDTFARELGLLNANGKALADLAANAKTFIPLPYNVKGMDLAFSGLLTKAVQLKHTHKKEDLAFSLMETSFAMVVEVTERAALLFDKKEIVLAGGVAQNTRLQNMIAGMAQHYGWKWGTAPSQFNRDNGAMIAFCGFLNKHNATKNIETLKVKPYFRFEELQDVVMVDNR